MMQDLSNLRRLGALLQWDLKFDLMSPVDELKSQIAREFDFVEEARHMDRMKPLLEEAVPAVTLPESRWASKRLLIMYDAHSCHG
jgi:predicted unusual protein kinase regulating ubiquinone biosynthesis (AarF/ABC1/UbiB family)